MDAFSILGSALILGGVGLVFAILIAMAHRRFHVWEDPRVDEVTEHLPGTNCGACGYGGCRAFAEGLVAGAAQPVACTVMALDDVEALAAFIGVAAGEADRQIARLLCAGGCNAAPQQAEYRGLTTCTAAAAVSAGGKSCPWGCLGLADCEVSCDFDAIFMNRDSLPVVIPELCTACGDCVEACPKDLFVLMSLEHKLIVQCRSPLAGEQITALCQVACDACGKCAQDAAPGLIEIVDGLAVIDYSKNELATPEATARCPTDAIVWVEGVQFSEPLDRTERQVA